MLHQQTDAWHRVFGAVSGATWWASSHALPAAVHVATWARNYLLPGATLLLIPSPEKRIRAALANLHPHLDPVPAIRRLVAPAVSLFRRQGAPPLLKGAPVNLLQFFTKDAAPVEAAVQLGEKIVQILEARASLFVMAETVIRKIMADAPAVQQEAAIKAIVDASPLPAAVKAFADEPEVLDAAMRIEDILRRDVLHQPGLPSAQA